MSRIEPGVWLSTVLGRLDHTWDFLADVIRHEYAPRHDLADQEGRRPVTRAELWARDLAEESERRDWREADLVEARRSLFTGCDGYLKPAHVVRAVDQAAAARRRRLEAARVAAELAPSNHDATEAELDHQGGIKARAAMLAAAELGQGASITEYATRCREIAAELAAESRQESRRP